MIPFESGHLALGGRIYRPQISYKCEMCSVAFLSYARNAKVCEKCRPMAKKIREKKCKARKSGVRHK